MKSHQVVRVVAAVAAVAVYGIRVSQVGNGVIRMFGFEINPFALTLLVILVVAVPETLDRLPVGPSTD